MDNYSRSSAWINHTTGKVTLKIDIIMFEIIPIWRKQIFTELVTVDDLDIGNWPIHSL